MFPSNITATVRIRRGGDWQVKLKADLIDGKRYKFRFGWEITDEDSSIYVGETAWMPESSDWPWYHLGAPAWIASGDLCDVRDSWTRHKETGVGNALFRGEDNAE